jgi:hypothetical protein
MKHHECTYCWKIGHEPEMGKYLLSGYKEEDIRFILKHLNNSSRWFHKSCYSLYLAERQPKQ